MIRHRIIATVIEAVLVAAVACPVYFVMARDGWGTGLSIATWLAVAFTLAPLTLALRALSQKNPAPDHLRRGLRLAGSGCHPCRWMRFWWPVAATPAAAAAALYVDMASLAALGLAATILHFATGLSALAEDREPHWSRNTGFSFEAGN